MTDALSEHAREQREEEAPPAKKQRSASVRPIYQFPETPSVKEAKLYADFCEESRTSAVNELFDDFVEAKSNYKHMFGAELVDTLGAFDRASLIMDIAGRITAERHREQRRRCAVSVGASMQD